MSESKIILVHGPDDKLTLKNGGVALEGIKSVKRTLEDGLPVVEVEALLAGKKYITSEPAALVLVVDEDGNETLQHGDQPLEGAIAIDEVDGVLKLKFAVASEDYAPLRAAKKDKKVEPKVEEKVALKPVVKKVEDKLED
jgi:hypothetical protein